MKVKKIFFDGLFREKKHSIDMNKAKEIMQEAKKNGEKISFQEAIGMSVNNGSIKTSVTEEDLYDSFYLTLNEIKSKLNSKENKEKIFESSASKKIKWLIFMIIGIFIMITIKPIIECGEIETLPFVLIFPGIGFSILIGSLIGTIKIPKLFGVIWGLGFGGVPWAFMMLPILVQNTMYIVMYVIGIISIAIIVFFTKIMPKKNTIWK